MTEFTIDADLRRRAQAAGVTVDYTSFWGEPRTTSPQFIEKVLHAMGDLPEQQPTAVVSQGSSANLPTRGEDNDRWELRQTDANGKTVCSGHGAIAELPSNLNAGYYSLSCASQETFIIVAPPRCWLPKAFTEGTRWWGISVQLYALRSASNWGIGDFSDLRDFATVAAAQGAAFVGLSPLHALFPHRPEAASPYSPSSRLALNPLFIDVTAVAEFPLCDEAQTLAGSAAFQRRLQELRDSSEVRYAEAAGVKAEILPLLWRHFLAHEKRHGTPRARAFEAFGNAHRATLGRHALFEAIQLHLHAADASVWGWPAWPEALHDPSSDAVANFAREHADQVQYRLWLQWLAHTQLAQAQRHARHAMPLGLYCDLAVGVCEGGAETWGRQALYASAMHIGAPPDPLNALGQDWGLAPINPAALSASRFAPFIAVLRSAMAHAGALRMDHVMALMRLFWTHGGEGTYVHYPMEALLAILAVESHRHSCAVIGEDLGNVDPQMRHAMQAHGLLSYRPLIFEREDDGSFRPPPRWPAQALAVVTTHDLPTLKGFWHGEDIELQARLELLPGESYEHMVLARAQDRARLLIALQHEGLLPDGVTIHPPSMPQATAEFAAAVHTYMARSPCWLAAAQLEDMIGQMEQVNVPGTTEEMHPNWRRRVGVDIAQLARDPGFAAVAAAMRRERGTDSAPASEHALPALNTADIPLATYRVQFHAHNTFAHVTQALDYLRALGIGHLYSSPYLKARPGSTHGYDVVDPTQLNPEIGTDQDHTALCDGLAARGMGQLLDIVPNHMAVLEADNPWWQDVLEHGQASAHAATFDIEWAPAAPEMRGRVLLPILGDHYGKVLEAGELQLRFDASEGCIRIHYWEQHAPIDTRYYSEILAAPSSSAPSPAGTDPDAQSLAEFHSLLDAFSRLPPRDSEDGEARSTRLRDAALYKRRLADLAAAHGWIRQWIDACLSVFNGRPGEPASFDALDQLLRVQAFRLADWRVAGDDINYRRFFDINALAAVRMEHPGVFEATHQRILRWLAEGKITGLRIDHPDGLSEPLAYFTRLQQRYAEMARAAGREPRALYIAVEKILADHETLPEDWPVHGGTGYRFSSMVNGLFIEPGARQAFDDAYEAFTGDAQDFDETVYECKKHIVESALSSELSWLTETLYRIARADRTACDFTRNRLRGALSEVAAGFPVYRTYLASGRPPAETELRHIEWALSMARRRLGTAEYGLLDYLQGIFTGAPGPQEKLREQFVRRWQQFTAPVMAKAMEDTAFYRFVRLVSLNDVGSEPRRFGLSPAAFHNANLQRQRFRPHWLLATSTHDSKRSEDVRARLNVLTEMPARWEDAVLKLNALGARFRQLVDGVEVPSAHDEWALYQTLAGIWPAGGTVTTQRDSLRERVKQYMLKAVREAKRESNWLFPNAPYEAALTSYIDHALASTDFVDALQSLVQDIAPLGFRNSLTQLALKLTVPGVPDIYQGCERWNFSLVDPDNRRLVDFPALEKSLNTLSALYEERFPSQEDWEQLLPPLPDGDIKHLVTWRLLQLRAALPELFRHGSYIPLPVEGAQADRVIAFARLREGKAIVVVAARLLNSLITAGWQDTSLSLQGVHPGLAKTNAWRGWMDGRNHAPNEKWYLRDLLPGVGPQGQGLPFCLLVAEDTQP